MSANQSPRGGKIHLSAFFVCAKLDGDPNGNITAHKIANKVTIQSDAPVFPTTEWHTPCHISFFTEGGKPEYDVSVRCQFPNGGTSILFTTHAKVSPGPIGGAIVPAPLTITMKQAGMYWLELLIDGMLISRYPLDVVFRRGGALN